MGRIPIRIRSLIAVIVAIAVIAGIVFYIKSRPTVTLRTLFSLPGYCDHFNEDGSFIVIRDSLAQTSDQSINDTKFGTLRLQLSSLLSGYSPSSHLPYSISFSSDSAFVGAPGKGIYDLRKGQIVLALSSEHYWFSPDNRFVATSADGVYELPNGKNVVSANGSIQAAFSHDSHYVALIGDAVGDTVYDLINGQQVFSDPREKWFGSAASFSPDGRYLAVDNDGLYQVATGKKIAQTSHTVFTSDSALAGTTNGVFDLTSGKRILPETMAKDSDAAYSVFSTDGQRVNIETSESTDSSHQVIVRTVYDIPTRKPLIQIKSPDNGHISFPPAVLSRDGQSLAIWQDGVYDVASGRKRFSIDAKTGQEIAYQIPLSFSFSQDNSVLFVPDVGAYDVHSGNLRFGIGIVGGASNDGRLVSDDKGVVDFSTGVRLADGGVTFPPNGNKIAIYSSTKQACTVVEADPAK